MSKVFIIGAGFSKGIANYPTSNELTKKIVHKSEEYSNGENKYRDLAIDFKKVYKHFSDQLINNLKHLQQTLTDDGSNYVVTLDEQIDIEYLITF